jgi:inorganic phosphate transporter, PiT family
VGSLSADLSGDRRPGGRLAARAGSGRAALGWFWHAVHRPFTSAGKATGMDVTTVSLFGLVALALLFDYTNGFHDSANSIATVVATRVLRPRWAVAWAAFFNFIAFLIVGTAVANTVGQTVKTEYFSMAVVFAALLGAIIWNYLSWHLGLPTSSSHALIGGLIGAGLAAGGTDAIKASNVQKPRSSSW